MLQLGGLHQQRVAYPARQDHLLGQRHQVAFDLVVGHHPADGVERGDAVAGTRLRSVPLRVP